MNWIRVNKYFDSENINIPIKPNMVGKQAEIIRACFWRPVERCVIRPTSV
jgi:hypothetical protein